MAVQFVPLVLLITFTAAVSLGRSALRAWWAQRAGEAYELPSAYGGAVVRAAGAAVLALIALTAAAVWLLPPSGGTPVRGRPAPAAPAEAAPRTPPRKAAQKPTRTPPRPPAPADTPRTLGQPEGGTLQKFQDGTQVWLPPQYAHPYAADLAFPVIVAYANERADDPDLLRGFTTGVRLGLADPFIIVLPPRCGTAPAPNRLARHYRIARGRTARGVLGVADQAPCAVREALARPERQQAAVGVSGVYGHDTPVTGTGAHRAELLLATVSGEEPERDSALRYRDAVRSQGTFAEIRVADRITPRRRLFALVAGYFTEKLDGPGHSYEGDRRGG